MSELQEQRHVPGIYQPQQTEIEKRLNPETNFILPTKGRLLVVEDTFSYSGRLVIPDAMKRKPTTGTVIAIGPEVELCYMGGDPPSLISIGDRVLFNVFSGTAVKFKGSSYCRMLQQDEILAVLTKKDSELEDVGA